jgi:uncharacterized membrane protein
MQDTTAEITELTDILDKDIENIVAMRLRAEHNVSQHQRLVERTTNTLGRPRTVYIILLVVTVWIALNLLINQSGIHAFDNSPFPLLQDIMSLTALIMTILVLTTQNRQNKVQEQRRHLDLQITLLTERKISKVIALLEELRQDLPSVTNRDDSEARVMQEPVDPHAALAALNQTFKHAEIELD